MTNVPLRRPILASQFFRPFLLCLVVALLAGLTPLGEMLAHAQSSTTVGGLQVNQGPVLPAMCNPNNSEISSKVFYLTSGANPGLYSCTAVNTWTAGGPGVGGGSLSANNTWTGYQAFKNGPLYDVTAYGASGSLRDGSTWDNAFAGLPATLVRGDVYYIATANYTGGYRFNTPESGTTVITIKKATPTDHCTETGWQASFGVGQAVWDISNGGTFQFTDNGYWVFDGQYRSGLKSGHGFKINWGTKGVGTSNTLYAVNVVGCASGPPCTPQLRNITVRYLEIAGGGVNGTTDDSFAISSVSRNAAGTQATVVTSSNARYIADNQPTVVGSLIAVSGVADASFNTTSARVIATSDQTHFTYANVGTANATSSGGTLTGGLGGLFEFDFRYTGTLDGLTLEYSYVHDSSDTPLQNDGRPSNTTIQYNVFARNTSSGNHHSEGFADRSEERRVGKECRSRSAP